jgi:hypothetical protein
MGEISFNYGVNTEPIHVANFKYRPSDSIEYDFAYQRYIAFSDASIFNSPVAITKVATGLYQYYDLFLEKKAYPTMYGNLIKNFDKVEHDTQDEIDTLSSHKTHRDVEFSEDLYRITRPYSFFVDIYKEGYQAAGEIKTPFIPLYGYWLLKDFRADIYFSPIIEKLYFNELDVYGDIYHLSRDNYLRILPKEDMLTPFDKELNAYDVILARPFRNGLGVYNIILGRPFDNELNITRNDMAAPFRNGMHYEGIDFGKRPDLVFNIIQQAALKYPRILKNNIIDQIQAKGPDFILNIRQQIVAQSSDKVIYAEDMLSSMPGDIYANIIDTISLVGDSVSINLFDTLNAYLDNKRVNSFQSFTTYKKNRKIEGVDSFCNAIRPDNEGFYYHEYAVYVPDKPIYRFDLNTFAISEQRLIFTIKDTVAVMDPKEIYDGSSMYQCIKIDKTMFLENDIKADVLNKSMTTSEMISGIKQDKHLSRNYGQDFVIKNDHVLRSLEKDFFVLKMQADLRLFNMSVHAFKMQQVLHKPDKAVFIGKLALQFDSLYEDYFGLKESHEISLTETVFGTKFHKSFVIENTQRWANKDSASTELYDDTTTGTKDRKSMNAHDSGVDIFKNGSSMDTDTLDFRFAFKDGSLMDIDTLAFESAQKDKLSMVLENDILYGTKDSHVMYLYSDEWITKDSHSMDLFTQLTANKDSHYITIFNQTLSFIKDRITVAVPDAEFIIKNHIPTDYANTLFNNYAGMIIPLSKVRHQSYIDSITLMAQKLAHASCVNQEVTASMIPKNTHIQHVDLFCDKQEHKVFIDYKNNQIAKAKIHTSINKDVTFEKVPLYCRLEAPIWADKISGKTWTDKVVTVQKSANKSFLEGILTTIKGTRDLYAQDSLFVDKLDQMCYYDYGMTWADKQLEARIENQLAVERSQQEGMLDCISPFIKKHIDAFYDYGIFSSKAIKDTDLSKQLHDVHKKTKDTGIHPDDFGNWAWVYETPDPFEGLGFGIDELLLPENDTRYEDFEELIFDKQNLRPKNPVKVIDDHTFIAKLPIKHPLWKKYSDVGIDYDKSGIKLDQFYGIETSIMHTVFLKFYRIWQSKIFEFGTMTMTQSVKLMLEYLYSWIMIYFPAEEVEQALRVFRLIRWYGETSIIQNSQYVISFEYGALESKLNTGTCMIPNDLDVNDTMYVDSQLGVIRNNPIYINQGVGASVTFFVNNKKNTTFTFSLSNTVGSVNIYINDVLVDTVSKSALNLTYELPYTGDTSVVKIEKSASHNLNGHFYIGNIKVPNSTFKELSIEFDPTLKAGNKPLNEIARKMIAYANLYEDREEAYNVIRKGNLGVGEIYKHLTEYWELHHQDKIKGKRLTIKEV